MATIATPGLSSGKNFQQQPVTAFPDSAIAVTPADADEFAAPVTIYSGGGGTVVAVPWARRAEAGPPTVNCVVPAGGLVPFRVARVMTATDATELLAVY